MSRPEISNKRLVSNRLHSILYNIKIVEATSLTQLFQIWYGIVTVATLHGVNQGGRLFHVLSLDMTPTVSDNYLGRPPSNIDTR